MAGSKLEIELVVLRVSVLSLLAYYLDNIIFLILLVPYSLWTFASVWIYPIVEENSTVLLEGIKFIEEEPFNCVLFLLFELLLSVKTYFKVEELCIYVS